MFHFFWYEFTCATRQCLHVFILHSDFSFTSMSPNTRLIYLWKQFFFNDGTLCEANENQGEKITKKMKSTLKRKLNPIIRYEGGRKFFFPTKDNVHIHFKNLVFFILCLQGIWHQWSHLFLLCHEGTYPIYRICHYVRNRN